MPPRSAADNRSDRPSAEAKPKPAKKPAKAAAKAPGKAAAKGAKAAARPKSPEKSSAKPSAKSAPARVEAAGATPVLKLRDLIDEVAEAAGTPRAAARTLVEATLEALGLALDRGDTLNLPPLGRLRVTRAKGAGEGGSLTLRLRRPGEAAAGKNPNPGRYEDLAVADE